MKITRQRMAVIITQAISNYIEEFEKEYSDEESYKKALEKLDMTEEEDCAICEVIEETL